jgi:hypothetical protein
MMDASDIPLEAIHTDKDEEGWLHLIGFHSRKFQLAEINYEVHDQELLTIVNSFKVRYRYLEGALCTVMVFRDD